MTKSLEARQLKTMLNDICGKDCSLPVYIRRFGSSERDKMNIMYVDRCKRFTAEDEEEWIEIVVEENKPSLMDIFQASEELERLEKERNEESNKRKNKKS